MIHVLGGTYQERCREPSWHFVFGSGLRAAVQLRRLKSRAHLHTLAADAEVALLNYFANLHGLGVDIGPIPETITFDYDHGCSIPNVYPDPRMRDYPHAKPVVEVRADRALCFGLIEGDARVIADEVVYDPQSPSAPRAFRTEVGQADRLAIIANRTEARRMGGSDKLETAARKIIKNERAEVVVIKMGPAGCLVVTKTAARLVPAFRTPSVFPIGSGDVFSAAFAHAWLDVGESPLMAAAFASRAAAHYCSSKEPGEKLQIKNSKFAALRHLPEPQHKQVYLAGPFFNVGQRWLIDQAHNALLDCGLRVFSPLHDVGRGNAADVYGPDIAGIRKSGVLLACLDGLDPGTLYEIGFAHALGLKVIVLVSAEREEDLKMVEGGGSVIVDDFTSAIYLTSWAASCA